MAKILIVDDRVTNRELLLTLLGYAGHQLLEATEGEEGLAITRAEHPDLIITDIMMPKMDGYEFARQVRADASIKDIQIIFYTSSYIVAETLRLANACGVSIVIGKPIEPEHFLKKINEALTTKQVSASIPASEEFHREHMRVLTDTLVNKVGQLEAEIIERQRAEEKLRETQEFFQALFNLSPVAYSLARISNHTIVDINPACENLFEYTKAEVIGRHTPELDFWVDSNERQNATEKFRRDGKLHNFEFAYKTKSGIVGWAITYANIIEQTGEKYVLTAFVNITKRKQIENNLQASELKLKLFVEYAPAAIAMLDRDMKYIAASHRYLTDYHLVEQDISGHSHYEIFPEVPERWKEIHRRCLAGAIEKAEEDPFPRADGSLDWVRWEIHPWYGEEGEVGGIILFSEVITERKRADAQIEYQANLLAHINDAVVAVDNQFQITAWNHAAEIMYGWSATEALGNPSNNIIRSDMTAEERQEVLRKLREFGMYRSEIIQYRKDGQPVYVEASTIMLYDKEKNVTGLLSVNRDITERKRSEEHVRYQANLLKNVSDAIIASDMTSMVTSWNFAAEEIYGWSAEEAIGSSITDLLQTEYENTTPDQIFKQFTEEGSWRGEVLQRCKNGSKIVVSASVSLIRDPQGNPVAMVAVNRDITKSKQIEQALHDSEGQYRKLFEDSPISFWVEDFSEVKKHLDALRDSGVNDVPAYLRNHPEFIRECANLIQVLDVNTAAVNLYRANNKADLIGSLPDTSVPMALDQIEYELIQLAKGQLNFEREGVDRTLTGEKVYVNIHWSVVPGYEHNLARVIVSTVDVTERKRAEQKIHHQLQRLNALRSIDLAISNTFDMKLSLRVLLNGTIAQLDVDAAAILLFNRPTTRLEYAAGEGFDTATIQKTNLRIGEGLAGRVALERRAIHVNNLLGAESGFVRTELLKTERFVSYYAVPLIAKGELKGILELFHRSELNPDQEWLDFLEILSGQAAIAIDNAQLFEGLQRSNLELSLAYDATIEGWSAALDLRDKETEGHSQRVTDMTIRLAHRMGVSESELIQIRRGALLHDIGKLGIPDHILLKPDKLTNKELEVMQKHPVYAYDMLSSIAYLKHALDIPFCHHEKWDGTGYPRGLKHEAIPLVARIFAIVDVWDALTSNRPYRAAWTNERTLEYIKEQSGTHFDPQVVDAFFKMMNDQ